MDGLHRDHKAPQILNPRDTSLFKEPRDAQNLGRPFAHDYSLWWCAAKRELNCVQPPICLHNGLY